MKRADQERLKQIESANRDLLDSHREVIESNGFLRLSARVIREIEWLCRQLRAEMRGGKTEEAEVEVAAE